MFLWFAGLAFAGAWQVFRDPAVDYRLLMVGAVLPDVLDAPLGGARLFHTLLASAAALVAVMLVTRHRRRVRRHLLAVPMGMLAHLVLDGVWTRTALFSWPLFGSSFEDVGLPSFDRPLAVIVVQELVGAAVLLWCWRRFGLTDRERRRTFLRTGRLARDVVA